MSHLRIALKLPGNRLMQSIVLLAISAMTLSGCGYNALQAGDEQVKAAWAEVLNQYQRRADLVPNLVNTVKGFAAQEKQVLTEVTAARSRVGTLRVNSELIENKTLFADFQQAQGQLSSALSRLLAVSENYPKLRSSTLFRDLQAQLEGTENRIAVARNRFIEVVQNYNIRVRSFPTNLTASLFGHELKATFATSDDDAISQPPPVDFSRPGATQ